MRLISCHSCPHLLFPGLTCSHLPSILQHHMPFPLLGGLLPQPGDGTLLSFQEHDTSSGNLFPPITLCLFIERNSGSQNWINLNLWVLKHSRLGIDFLFSLVILNNVLITGQPTTQNKHQDLDNNPQYIISTKPLLCPPNLKSVFIIPLVSSYVLSLHLHVFIRRKIYIYTQIHIHTQTIHYFGCF